MEQILSVFKTELWNQLSDFLILLAVVGLLVSILVEAVKRTAKGVFNFDNIYFSFLLPIIISFGMSFAFSFVFMNYEKTWVTVVYAVTLSLSVWGVSFLSYLFVIKWLFLAFETIVNIFKGFKLESDLKVENLNKNVEKIKDVTNTIKEIENVIK